MKKVLLVIIPVAALAVAAWFYKAYKTVPSLPFYEKNVISESGQVAKLDDFKNQYVLISYFQTWCGVCIRELGDIDALQMRVGKDKLKVLMVSDEDTKKIIRFKEKYCNTLDYYQSTESLNQISIRIFPTTYLLDKKGNVILSKINFFDWNSEEVLNLIK
jgi:peroxiredoxin